MQGETDEVESELQDHARIFSAKFRLAQGKRTFYFARKVIVIDVDCVAVVLGKKSETVSLKLFALFISHKLLKRA